MVAVSPLPPRRSLRGGFPALREQWRCACGRRAVALPGEAPPGWSPIGCPACLRARGVRLPASA